MTGLHRISQSNLGLVNCWNRRVLPVAPRPREGPLTEPTAGPQPCPRERVLMPLKRPCRRDRERRGREKPTFARCGAGVSESSLPTVRGRPRTDWTSLGARRCRPASIAREANTASFSASRPCGSRSSRDGAGGFEVCWARFGGPSALNPSTAG
jgi:hypothetical protein